MIIQGNSLHLPLKDESCDMCLSSPPYWGLRSYLDKDDPLKQYELGSEKTPEEYVENMVQVFREVKRVLKKEGTLWLNIGDSYAGSWGNYHPTGSGGQRDKVTDRFDLPAYQDVSWRPPTSNTSAIFKPKDLVGIPWMLAFALRADGWYLRSDIIWAKKNCMPESTLDRCTKSHEYIFMLTKSARYFFDMEAVKEDSAYPDDLRAPKRSPGAWEIDGRPADNNKGRMREDNSKRNLRDVWWLATAPFSEWTQTSRLARAESDVVSDDRKRKVSAHFATFPPALAERCIKAGTSEKGVCPECGKAWVRVVERVREHGLSVVAFPKSDGAESTARLHRRLKAARDAGEPHDNALGGMSTTGWLPQCSCNLPPIPSLVCDIFGGAGTVDLVAKKLNRRSISVELKGEYCTMAKNRVENQCGTLF